MFYYTKIIYNIVLNYNNVCSAILCGGADVYFARFPVIAKSY